MTFAIEKRSKVICSPSLVTEEFQSQERFLQKTVAICDSCPFWKIPTEGFGILFHSRCLVCPWWPPFWPCQQFPVKQLHKMTTMIPLFFSFSFFFFFFKFTILFFFFFLSLPFFSFFKVYHSFLFLFGLFSVLLRTRAMWGRLWAEREENGKRS